MRYSCNRCNNEATTYLMGAPKKDYWCGFPLFCDDCTETIKLECRLRDIEKREEINIEKPNISFLGKVTMEYGTIYRG